MKDENVTSKTGVAVESQTQAQAVISLKEIFLPPNIDDTKADIDVIIDGNKKEGKPPHPEISILKKDKTSACKIARTLQLNTEMEVKRANTHISFMKNIQEEIEGIFEAPRKFFHDVKTHVLKRRDELIAELIETQGILKAGISAKATEKAIALQEKNDAAFAMAATQTENKKENLTQRADKWEGKGNVEKAEFLRQEAEVAEVIPDVEYEDPKNWRFESYVLNKREFLLELANDEKSDLSGIVIQKSLLNAIARALMSGRPRDYQKTDWGYCKGKKLK